MSRRTILLTTLSLLSLLSSQVVRAQAAPAIPDRTTLEKQFADMMNNATLIGSFNAGNDGKPPQEDRYTILKAVKAEGDDWVITAKIGYKGVSLPIDITVQVRWAGDTPMIQLTDHKIPGFGTFTCRLMFYKDQYAGTWDGGDHGGLMWGRIERGAKPASGPTTKPAP